MTNANTPTAAVESFELIIPSADNTQVLLAEKGGHLLLPEVIIPKWERVAQSITKCVRELWDLRAVCLFQTTSPHDSHRCFREHIAVLEIRDHSWRPPADLNWIPRNIITDILSPLDASAVENVLNECDSYNNGVLYGPFARRGWMDELVPWVEAQINDSELKLTGQFLQLNASPDFCLIRLETANGSGVWFKAVGGPNRHEYDVTLSLAGQRPEYFPEIIAANNHCKGWLMKEVEGVLLEQTCNCEDWLYAATTLGRMQADFLGQEQRLVAAGCRDLRLSTIMPQIDEFLEAMEGLMQRQRTDTPRPLSKLELLQLGKELKVACHGVAELDVPDTLGHCDLNPGNVIVNGGSVAFIDWVEAYVGNPLPTFEYLSLAFNRYLPGCKAHKDSLYRVYADSLGMTIRPSLLSKASAFAPLLGVLFAAIHGEWWSDGGRACDDLQAKYLRSLARRIRREIEALNGNNSSV